MMVEVVTRDDLAGLVDEIVDKVIKALKHEDALAREAANAASQKSLLDAKTLYTRKEITEILGIPASTWWQGVSSGKYPKPCDAFTKPRRWRAEDLKQLRKVGEQ